LLVPAVDNVYLTLLTVLPFSVQPETALSFTRIEEGLTPAPASVKVSTMVFEVLHVVVLPEMALT
jgi:hypothetical protein